MADTTENDKVPCTEPWPALSAAGQRDEAASVAALLPVIDAALPDEVRYIERATALAREMRRRRQRHAMERLIGRFSPATPAGRSLMVLAEAFLRAPDAATRHRLLADTLGRLDPHDLAGDSLSERTGRLALRLYQRLPPRLRAPIDRLAGCLCSALLRRLGGHFVLGETLPAARERARVREHIGYTHSYDMLGEAALTEADASAYGAAYLAAIQALAGPPDPPTLAERPGISVKLSALHPRYQPLQRARVLRELYPRLRTLAIAARDSHVGMNIDAEEADRLALSLDLFERLARDPALAGWPGLGFVVQAYQKRALAVVDHLIALARDTGGHFMIRLVKGAYWDSEIKRAQQAGLAGYPVFTRKAHTDLSYLACAARLLAAPDAVYPQIATHNPVTVAAIEAMAARLGGPAFEFQCLHGMGEPLYDALVGTAPLSRHCRIYAPVGPHRHLLPYLVRRLLENGANSAFLHQLMRGPRTADPGLCDPRATVREGGGQPHPAIPLPSALYGPARRNPAGLDLTDPASLHAIASRLADLAPRRWRAAPQIAGPLTAGAHCTLFNPATGDIVGDVQAASAADIDTAVGAAVRFADTWRATPGAERASRLRHAADALDAARDTLASLLIREAGKTLPNAIGEIREAIDACRYHAHMAETLADLPGSGSGPLACISPWNFPLAIFIGQIAAALAAGRPVLAKPAEETPLVADVATACLRAAGIPAAALQLLPGPGETVGAALVADPRLTGVLFTGSTAVAKQLHRVLAPRGALLVAETGGVNALLVDSTALPEQVVTDVIASAFDSAGQRCSALRLLCLPETIAEPVLAMLRGALGLLTVGDPADLDTDIGPMINNEARASVARHVDALRARACRVWQTPLPATPPGDSFYPPTLIELRAETWPLPEVFGPVLHVLRYPEADMDTLLARIASLGYGLTFGLHSRLQGRIGSVAGRFPAGNRYVNRSLIGAVVGVQPFGGEGLSGTGPKAGGPLTVAHLAGIDNPPPARLGLRPVASGDPAAYESLCAAVAALPKHRLPDAGPLSRWLAGDAPRSMLSWQLDLPGPTGEDNTLSFAPRGWIGCLADSAPALLMQLSAVLVTGNRPALLGDTPGLIRGLALPRAVTATFAPPALPESDLAAVLLSPGLDPETVRAYRTRLSTLPGPLRPAIPPDAATGRYPLYRLLTERVLTVDTTAAGGNTALLSLAG